MKDRKKADLKAEKEMTKELDKMDKEIVDQATSLICSYFEHINKWINIEKENNV